MEAVELRLEVLELGAGRHGRLLLTWYQYYILGILFCEVIESRTPEIGVTRCSQPYGV